MASKNTRSARKGKATEQLIAATCVLATDGELNALTAMVDDEGVDVGFKRRNGTRTLDVQVKARFSDDEGSKKLREEGIFVSDVREETFGAREDLYVLYVVVHGPRAEIETAWLVPSEALVAEGFSVSTGGITFVRFQASVKESSEDKWREYRMPRDDLPGRLLEVATALEPEVLDDSADAPPEDGSGNSGR